MTILVPSWSRVDFFLRNRYKINYFFIFSQSMASFQMKMIKNLALITFIWTKNEKCLTSGKGYLWDPVADPEVGTMGMVADGTWIFRYFPVRYLYLFATWPVRYLPFRYLTCSLPSVFATCIFRYPDFFKPTLGKH